MGLIWCIVLFDFLIWGLGLGFGWVWVWCFGVGGYSLVSCFFVFRYYVVFWLFGFLLFCLGVCVWIKFVALVCVFGWVGFGFVCYGCFGFAGLIGCVCCFLGFVRVVVFVFVWV